MADPTLEALVSGKHRSQKNLARNDALTFPPMG
jgi:hypothetical protein